VYSPSLIVDGAFGPKALCDAQMLVGTVFALSAVMMGAKFYIDRNVQREDVRPCPLCWSNGQPLSCAA